MEKQEILYEGKAKKVFKTNKDDVVLVEFKDSLTAFNGLKKDTIMDKGIINNKITSILFNILEEEGIDTHFINQVDDRSMLVKALKIIPVEVVVRNIAAGNLAKALGLEEGTVMKETVVEFYYKSDALGDPMINNYHIKALNLATENQLEIMVSQALKINKVLQERFKKLGIILVDFKLEFGIYNGKVILGDEISPDTCRLWDMETKEKMDKDRFRRDLGKVKEYYMEVLNRLKGVN